MWTGLLGKEENDQLEHAESEVGHEMSIQMQVFQGDFRIITEGLHFFK